MVKEKISEQPMILEIIGSKQPRKYERLNEKYFQQNSKKVITINKKVRQVLPPPHYQFGSP